MARRDTLDEQRKKDRLAAQLGLGAAGESQASGECLTADQLADVATNTCSVEERQAALAHFSSCQQCYDAWVGVSLSLVAMESGLQRGRKPLVSLRNMGYLGSAVAIAASVVVFFNLQGDLLETSVTPPARMAVEQLQPRDSAVSPQGEAARIEQAVSPQAGAPPVAARKKLEPRPQEQPAGRQAAGAVGKSGQETEMEQSAPAVADQVRLRREADSGITADGWLSELEAVCRQEQYREEPELWTGLQARGKLALATAADPVLRQRLTAVLALMTAITVPEEAEAQCRAILPLLAGAEKKE